MLRSASALARSSRVFARSLSTEVPVNQVARVCVRRSVLTRAARQDSPLPDLPTPATGSGGGLYIYEKVSMVMSIPRGRS